MSAVTLDEHLDLFRKGIAAKLDFVFSGQPAVPLATLVQEGSVVIGSIHTYLELYSYAEYGVQCLNHGIGYATAAIELLLPTYALEQGFKGKICSHWALNPHPTMMPAIESGMVTSIHSFGSEPGMEA